MYVLIDCTNKIAIAKHQEYQALAALAYIQFTNVECTIVPLDHNRNFAQFDHNELGKIAYALGLAMPKKNDYGALIKQVKAGIESAEQLNLPFGLDALLYQANTIHPDCDLPRNFVPPTDAHQLQVAGWPGRWAMEPQLNRRRKDSTYGSMFGILNQPPERGPHTHIIDKTSPPGRKVGDLSTNAQNTQVNTALSSDKVDPRESAHSIHDEESNMSATAEAVAPKTSRKNAKAPAAPKPPKAGGKKLGAADPAAMPVAPKKAPAKPVKAAAGKTPAAPKAPAKPAPAASKKGPKVEASKESNYEKQNGITRPKAGGTTSQVWAIADALLEKSGKGNPPSFNDVLAAVEKKKLDINPGTLRTQYGNWRRFHGIAGRV